MGQSTHFVKRPIGKGSQRPDVRSDGPAPRVVDAGPGLAERCCGIDNCEQWSECHPYAATRMVRRLAAPSGADAQSEDCLVQLDSCSREDPIPVRCVKD